jgi:octaprenyl-diphosphate synthase
VSLERILQPVASDLADVEDRLLSWADGELPVVANAVRQIVGSGGKRLRPALLLLSAGLGPGRDDVDASRRCDLAAAVEIVHTASLIHDDIVDRARLRRGRPTLHARLSPQIALLVGDLLYARLLEGLTEGNDDGTFKDVAATVHRMVAGELAETLQRNDLTTSEAAYLRVVADKTGALFSCTTRLGARAGGVDDEAAAAMGTYGEQLGLAFQIVDDVLDLCESEDDLGKPAGADIAEGKITLPLIHAVAQDRSRGRDVVERLFDERDVGAICAQMLRYGSLQYAMGVAEDAARRAGAALERLGPSVCGPHAARCRSSLADLAEYVVARGRTSVTRPAPLAAGVE